MVDTRQLLEASESDPLGATTSERPQPTHSPSLPPYSPGLGKSRLLTVIYTPSGDANATPHTALIPWTSNYETALSAAKEAFEQYFPPNSAQRRRWLTTRVQTSSGVTWAEFQPALFSQIVGELGVELRLCEDRRNKLDVTVLPIGHEQTTAEGDSYYQFKIITVGQRSVGKSMMLQYFTKPEEDRFESLPNTVGPSMDIANRFMTAHGELVKTVLWDTAGQETFRAMTKPLYRGVHGVFLVYSIADAESFNNCLDWLNEIRGHVDEHVPIMLIGNQIDRIEERAVATSDGQAFALEHGLLFAEISGQYGTNVDNAFQKLVHEIFNGLKDRDQLYTCKETKRSARSRRLPVGPEQSWHQRARSKCCA
ncbi:Ras-related protein Rab-11A [Rhizoctonia solani]|uniref:Ras-related protein Rab-11A n=1 Tax=Rhizoctonia solani TaxID=456999 RepID=A0A0K6G104_9AGAM|nr:Ras-related protein Rab-11A [Rhizoctonia solani]